MEQILERDDVGEQNQNEHPVYKYECFCTTWKELRVRLMKFRA